MIHYNSCPVCKSEMIQVQLSAKDHTVSRGKFSIWHCNACTLRFTQDVPGQDAIGAYYASENYISHSDTKKGIINNLYHRVRKRTLVSKRKLVMNETSVHVVITDLREREPTQASSVVNVPSRAGQARFRAAASSECCRFVKQART